MKLGQIEANVAEAFEQVAADIVALRKGQVSINDTAGAGVTNQTWSADQITKAIAASSAALTTSLSGGSSTALAQLQALQTELSTDETSAAALATSVAGAVRFDIAQTLTSAQQIQVATNLGLGTTDFLSLYTAITTPAAVTAAPAAAKVNSAATPT